ncbi:MAG: hypothetical protein QM648_03185 [Solirubrobacterales bacterium]
MIDLLAEIKSSAVRTGSDDFIFTSESGKLVCPDNYRKRVFRAAVETADLPDRLRICLRRLLSKLRYRKLVGDYGWVLQRQENGTLHYHGIFFMKWFTDDLMLWRKLVVESGFGPQNFIERARPTHARYCAKYISTRLAELESGHRAYGFSRGFPAAPSPSVWPPPEEDDCVWEPLFGPGRYSRVLGIDGLPDWLFDPPQRGSETGDLPFPWLAGTGPRPLANSTIIGGEPLE